MTAVEADEPVSVVLERGERRSYRAGCRCDECRGADLDYQRGRRPIVAYESPVTLESTPPPGDWIRHARCKAAPTNLFFPMRGEDARPAKEICRGCPALAECRDYALAAPSTLQGVWGGMSAKERRPGHRMAS